MSEETKLTPPLAKAARDWWNSLSTFQRNTIFPPGYSWTINELVSQYLAQRA